jgi:sugar phosphate isomerase/epimerase
VKLGITGLLPSDPRAIDRDTVERVREAGFVGATAYFHEEHRLIDTGLCRQIRALFSDGGVELVQLGGWMAPLIDHDPDQMRWNADQRREVIRVAGQMGFQMVSLGSGTLCPQGGSGFDASGRAWFPDKRNWGQKAFDLTVKQLKATASIAAEAGVHIALEHHLYSVLSSPERTRDILDAVGSPWVGVTIDPGNWLTPLDYFDNGNAIRRMLDILGDRILQGHAKDIRLENHRNILMPETYVGDGGVDFVTLLRCLNDLNPSAYIIIEHTPVDLIPKAKDNLVAFAREAGVALAQTTHAVSGGGQ